MGTLYFGGSFNPIHNGHLICARAAAEACQFDRLVLVPTAQSPHKMASTDAAPAADRLEMCRLAVAGRAPFEVDDLELRRSGPSYTFDSAAELARRGENPVRWLIGADMLLDLPHWHRARELISQVEFVVMERPGWTLDRNRLPPEFRQIRATVVQAPLIEISASQIRRRVAEGRSIDFLTPTSVVDYIHSHSLYR